MIPPESIKNQIVFNFISSESILDDPDAYKTWIINTVTEEGKSIASINYIFCDDAYLVTINKKYLNHDDYTDIITFPYAQEPLESDIFISLERVKENAIDRNLDPLVELRRVMIHGVLHLCGLKDKTKEEKKIMRSREDYYLDKF